MTSEVEAARASRPTSGAHDLLADLHAAGVPVVIVANSAADAAQAYLERWDVVRFFRHIVGRPEFQPDLMRPNIHTVELAISLAEAHPAGTVMIGDSVSDVQASHAAGTGVIGYTKNYLRGVALAKAGADTLTKDIDSLVL